MLDKFLKASKIYDCRGEENFINNDGSSGSYQKGRSRPQKEEKFVNIDGEFFLNDDAIFTNNDVRYYNSTINNNVVKCLSEICLKKNQPRHPAAVQK
jgi:hypothetical protein